jgi:excisionase family DNA binding protein
MRVPIQRPSGEPQCELAAVMKPLLTPKEAAKLLAISDRQLRDLVSQGHIAFVNVGAGNRPTRRYDPTDIEAFMRARKSVANPSIVAGGRSTAHSRTIDASDFQARLDARAKARSQV